MLPPSAPNVRSEDDGRPSGSRKKVELNPATCEGGAADFESCSFNVTVSRRLGSLNIIHRGYPSRLIAWHPNTQIDFRYSIRSAFSCSVRLVWK